ncbi:MAG: ABC transporter substrate-binding protein [Acetanaerobacterium sp.]
MKKRTGFLALAISTILTLSVFSGCAQTPSNTDPDSPSSAGGGDQAAAGAHSINIWCWDKSDAAVEMHRQFKEETGIEVQITAVESKDVTQKLQTTLASGGQMPDIAWLEATYRGKLLSLNIWEDITKDPYNFDKSNVLDYLVPLETSEDGRYVGPECPSVAGMAYKRELTKEYFGTDDPQELEAMMSDWDSFIQAGKEVATKSEGKVFMLSSLGAAGNMLKGQSTEPFIDGDKLNLETSMKPILERLIQIKQAGMVDVLDFDSPEEGASYAGDEHIFYPCANWSVKFTIKGNDKDSTGRWGFMLPPGGPFPWGGTVMGVPQKAANKEDAVNYIKFFFGSEEGAALQRDNKGNFSPYKPVYDDDTFYSGPDDYFAGQDVLKAIGQEVLPNITSVRLPSKYDQDINDVYNLAIKSINAATDGNITADDLIAKMNDDLVNKQPNITK